MKLLMVIFVFGVYSKFGATVELPNLSQNDVDTLSKEKRSVEWTDTIEKRDGGGYNGLSSYYPKSSLDMSDEVPETNDSEAEDEVVNDIVNDLNELQRDEITNIKNVMDMADLYGYKIPLVTTGGEPEFQTSNTNSDDNYKHLQSWLTTIDQESNIPASDLGDSYDDNDIIHEQDLDDVDKRARPYNILDDYNFKRAPGWSVTYGKRAPGWSAVYGKRAPGWSATYGKRAPGWSAVYGKRAPGWSAVYGKRAPGWSAVYGKRAPGWSAVYGKRAPGWSAVYGKRAPGWSATYGKRAPGWAATYGKRAPGWAATYGKRAPGWAATYGKRAQGWAALYGKRAPGWSATYGKRMPGWTATYGKRAPGWAATYGKRQQGWAALYGKRAPGWSAVYGKRDSDSSVSDDDVSESIDSSKRGQGWAALYGR